MKKIYIITYERIPQYYCDTEEEAKETIKRIVEQECEDESFFGIFEQDIEEDMEKIYIVIDYCDMFKTTIPFVSNNRESCLEYCYSVVDSHDFLTEEEKNEVKDILSRHDSSSDEMLLIRKLERRE